MILPFTITILLPAGAITIPLVVVLAPTTITRFWKYFTNNFQSSFNYSKQTTSSGTCFIHFLTLNCELVAMGSVNRTGGVKMVLTRSGGKSGSFLHRQPSTSPAPHLQVFWKLKFFPILALGVSWRHFLSVILVHKVSKLPCKAWKPPNTWKI